MKTVKTMVLRTSIVTLCLIDDINRKAKKCDRSELLASKHQKKTNEIIPFVHTCTYTPRNQNKTPIIHQINYILINDQSTIEIYKDVNFIYSRLQAKKYIKNIVHFPF